MQVILIIMNMVFSPVLNALFTIFPDLGEMFNHVTTFISQAVIYVSTILEWFLFSPAMFAMLFDYFIIKYSIHLLITGVKFGINMYNKLKP